MAQLITPFRHILVPTDFSEEADRALACAIDLAMKLEARITIFHASWLPPLAYAAFAEGIAYPTADMTKGAEKRLDAAVLEAKKRHVRVEGVVQVGEPRRTILDVAEERGANLIVMGTHGRQGVSRLLLGSVAEAVVRLSKIPVLTVP